MERNYVIYGSEFSYFTKKLHAAIHWSGLPYEYRIYNSENADEVSQRAATHQIPVIRTPENWMIADTTPILHLLDSRLGLNPIFYPKGLTGALTAIMEEYFDEWVTRIAIHYRWNKPESSNVLAPKMGKERMPENGEVAANAIRNWGGRACRARGIVSEIQMKAGEEELDRIYTAFEFHLKKGNRFVFGDRPTAVDTVIMGGLLAHFKGDPAPSRDIAKFKKIDEWVVNWTTPIPKKTAEPGVNLTVPPPFVQFMFTEMSGIYKDFTLANAKAYYSGEKSFTLKSYGGEVVSYKVIPYIEQSRIMLKEFLATSLTPADQKELVSFLKRYKLDQVFSPELPKRKSVL
jgi:glutathione S-transferase